MHSTKKHLTVYVFREYRRNAHTLWIEDCEDGCCSLFRCHLRLLNSIIFIYCNHYDEIANIPNSLLLLQIKSLFHYAHRQQAIHLNLTFWLELENSLPENQWKVTLNLTDCCLFTREKKLLPLKVFLCFKLNSVRWYLVYSPVHEIP